MRFFFFFSPTKWVTVLYFSPSCYRDFVSLAVVMPCGLNSSF